MVFAEEKILAAIPEAIELMYQHNVESGVLDGKAFQPDIEKYDQLEKLGMLRAFTARKNNVLIGYCTFFITPHLHYPSTSWAKQDALFMSPQYRGLTGVRFIQWSDSRLRDIGVKFIHRSVRPNRDYSRTLVRLGYELCETQYLKGM